MEQFLPLRVTASFLSRIALTAVTSTRTLYFILRLAASLYSIKVIFNSYIIAHEKRETKLFCSCEYSEDVLNEMIC